MPGNSARDVHVKAVGGDLDDDLSLDFRATFWVLRTFSLDGPAAPHIDASINDSHLHLHGMAWHDMG